MFGRSIPAFPVRRRAANTTSSNGNLSERSSLCSRNNSVVSALLTLPGGDPTNPRSSESGKAIHESSVHGRRAEGVRLSTAHGQTGDARKPDRGAATRCAAVRGHHWL